VDLRFSAEDEAFRAEARDWLITQLEGEFAVVRGRGGPGDEHSLFEERLEWEHALGRAPHHAAALKGLEAEEKGTAHAGEETPDEEAGEEEPGEKPSEEAGGEEAAAGPDAAAGKEVFAEQCSVCHGADGLGGNGGPDLTTMPKAKEQAGAEEQVTNGGGGMPAFAGTLSEEEIANVAAYVVEDINGK